VAEYATQHACRTIECWTEHARNADGSSRCLWGSRDGHTPAGRWGRGSYACDQPRGWHKGPHTFGLRLKLRITARTWLRFGAGGALAGMLIAAALLKVLA